MTTTPFTCCFYTRDNVDEFTSRLQKYLKDVEGTARSRVFTWTDVFEFMHLLTTGNYKRIVMYGGNDPFVRAGTKAGAKVTRLTASKTDHCWQIVIERVSAQRPRGSGSKTLVDGIDPLNPFPKDLRSPKGN